MRLNLKLITSVVIMFLTTSCATVMSDPNEVLSVKIIDAKNDEMLENVSCTFTDGHGDRYMVKNGNPGTVSIPRGRGELTVKCDKVGYKQLNTSVGESFNKTTLLNVLFWPGAVVDGVTGAYKKYPSHYVVSMEKTGLLKR